MALELLRFLTCGSVDDGKSTLIGRLLHDTQTIYEDQLDAVRRDSARFGTTRNGIDLALLTDGLRAEREQGITIDVAYRSFATAKRRFIIADTPGHEQYTRNMVTGASRCDAAVILVDARHGVLTQTRRHSYIVALLGIKRLVVAVNKMDLVGYAEEAFERIRRDYAGFAGKLDVPDVWFIPMSALRGDNVVERSRAMPWYGGPTLLDHLETMDVASDATGAAMRFPVQYVIRPSADYRGFAGTIASGVLRAGDAVMALPSGRTSTVKSIVTYDGELAEAFAPMAVTVRLADQIDVSRGDMLVHPGAMPRVAAQVEAMVVWMAEKLLVPGRSYWLKQTTRTVVGRIDDVRYGVDVNTLERHPATQLGMNEVGHVVLELTQPIAHDPYARNQATGAFILIDRMTNATVGAGMIMDAERRDDGWALDRVAGWLAHRESLVTLAERERRFGQRGATVLLYGLAGSGKATIASALERRLFDAGRAVTVLYGPAMRQGLSRDLGFTADDYSENLRRAAEVAKLVNDAGLLCICAVVAPPEAVPGKAAEVIGADRVVTVHLSAPLEVCLRRDRSGAYRRGKLVQFPGVPGAREAPPHVDLELPTDQIPVEESVERILGLLRERRFIPQA